MSLKLRNMTSIYIVDKNRILFLYRIGSKVADQSYVGTAGGHFLMNELNDPQACVLRELNEELGLDSDAIENLQLRYIGVRQMGNEIRQLYYYFANLKNPNVELISNEGNLEWVDFKDVKNLKMPLVAKLAIEHYLTVGRDTKELYGGIIENDSVQFHEMNK